MSRLRLILLFVLLPCLAKAANVDFGHNATTHGSGTAIGTSTIGNAGQTSKKLIYFAATGDVLDSIWIYAAGTAATESIAVALYSLSSDAQTFSTRVYVDTFKAITTSAGDFGINVNVALTAKTWYGLAVCSTSSSSVVNVYAGATAIGFTVQLGDRETKTGALPSPWGTAGTNVATPIELWGAVTQAAVTGTRRQVTYVSDRDTIHTTAQTTLVIGKPADITDGDVLLACLVKGDGFDQGTWTSVPSGWVTLHTSGHTTGGDDQCTWYGYKIVTNWETEPSTYSWSLGESEESSGGIIAFRNVDTSVIFDVTPLSRFIAASTSTSKPDCPALTTLTDSAMIVCFGTFGADTSNVITPPASFNSAWARRSTSLTLFAGSTCAYKMQAAKGATGALTFTRSNGQSATLTEATFALRPKTLATGSTAIMLGD